MKVGNTKFRLFYRILLDFLEHTHCICNFEIYRNTQKKPRPFITRYYVIIKRVVPHSNLDTHQSTDTHNCRKEQDLSRSRTPQVFRITDIFNVEGCIEHVNGTIWKRSSKSTEQMETCEWKVKPLSNSNSPKHLAQFLKGSHFQNKVNFQIMGQFKINLSIHWKNNDGIQLAISGA